ncbi:group 2 truncated hemoglobin GlbO [mine drainage metagenome]|uniref:Group 2 truncated hemoglobin GlbO n=1 Tax=mine drainage metagenome TaxID=410659 RepID=A0A1J5TYR6_9ZZZZ
MQISNDKRSHYERIGGEAKVRELVQRFYHLMDELPEAYGIRKMHQPSLKGAEDKLFMFLSGWMGGPPLFVEKFGHPALRMRHMPFSIGKTERDQWLLCMGQALDEVVEEEALRNELKAAFIKVADFMRNQSEPD